MNSSAADITDFIDSLKLRHFSGSELAPLWSRVHNGVSNTEPPKVLWSNLSRVLAVLDEVRQKLEYPVTINSAYRVQAYNRAVGGRLRSYHLSASALDWYGHRETSREWAAMAQSMRGMEFDTADRQRFILVGGIIVYKTFVHVDVRNVRYDRSYY